MARLAAGRPDDGSETPERPAALRASFAIDLIAAVSLVYILFWNLTTVSSFAMPAGSTPLGLVLGFDQSWRMFSPSPPVDDGWYVIPGELEGGGQVDLMSVVREDLDPPEGVSWEKPENVAYTDNNEHWRKYLEAIGQVEHAHQRAYFAGYLCRAWNGSHGGEERLKRLEIAFVREKTLPDYRPPKHEKVLLWKQGCPPGRPPGSGPT